MRRSTAVHAAPDRQPLAVYTARLTSTVFALAATVTVSLAAYVYGGSPLGVTVLGASALALAGWLATARGGAVENGSAFNLLVLTTVALMLVYAEQWSTGFPAVLIRSFPAAYPPGTGLSGHSFIAVFTLAGMAMLVLGLLGYYHRLPIGEFAAWFTFSWTLCATILAYVTGLLGSHGPHYVGGLAFGPVASIFALLGIRRLVEASSETGSAR